MNSLRSAKRLASALSELLGQHQRRLWGLPNLVEPTKQALPVLSARQPISLVCAQHSEFRGFTSSPIRLSEQAEGRPPGSAPQPPEGEGQGLAASSSSSGDSEDENGSDAEPEYAQETTSSAVEPVTERPETNELLQKIQSASKKHQKHMLQQMLSRNATSAGQALQQEEQTLAAIDAAREHYALKLVDVNSTNKGSPKGGIQSFSAMVVVGNQEGLLGHGTGKAAELVAAIRKASMRALNNLTFVPRYERFTILHPVDTKYGKCKLRMYPLSSGSGIRANALLGDIAALAGINAIGIKVHGSRNARNSVKAMFQAFEQLTTIEKMAQEKGMIALEVISGTRPPPKQRFKYSTRLTK